jgi:glutamyl-tRNA reductase
MHIIVVGLNYRTAPVEVREKFTFSEAELPEALRRLKQTKSILECVIVATCNRTELYAVVDRLNVCRHYINSYLESWFGISRDTFSRYLYMYEDQEAIRHLFRVTCGLDSMVIGETQILGQVRDAFLLAQQTATTGTLFNKLFREAVTVAKQAQTETTIGENAVSVSYAAVELGRKIFGSFAGKKVMVIGAGKMSELTAKHLHAGGVGEVVVANRTLERAEELARKFAGSACSIDKIGEKLAEIDIVISSTGSAGYVLTKKDVEQIWFRRKAATPLFIIDIAVPRDIDPAIAELDNVFLYDIDDLEGIVESNLEQRRNEALKIEKMIEEGMEEFDRWYRTLGVGPVIRALQEKSSAIHAEVMESLFNKLPDLSEREVKVIRKLTKSIVNQMLHDPINRIKEMAAGKNGEEALEMFVQFFALEERVQELVQQSERKKTEKADQEKVSIPFSSHPEKMFVRN